MKGLIVNNDRFGFILKGIMKSLLPENGNVIMANSQQEIVTKLEKIIPEIILVSLPLNDDADSGLMENGLAIIHDLRQKYANCILIAIVNLVDAVDMAAKAKSAGADRTFSIQWSFPLGHEWTSVFEGFLSVEFYNRRMFVNALQKEKQ
ncbi:MAG: hypothetical protein WCG83_06485 [Candidatus Peregrinibacteria bacterium]